MLNDPPASFNSVRRKRALQTLFSDAYAEARFGASVFWGSDGMLAKAVWEDFVDLWQTRRDAHKGGMIEIKP